MTTQDGRLRCSALIRCADDGLRRCLLHERGRVVVGQVWPLCLRHRRMVETGTPVIVRQTDGGLLILIGGHGYPIPAEATA
ncbi:MAG: hypothetical protein AB7R89_28300 [Dehalococcoidia bacterium]